MDYFTPITAARTFAFGETVDSRRVYRIPPRFVPHPSIAPSTTRVRRVRTFSGGVAFTMLIAALLAATTSIPAAALPSTEADVVPSATVDAGPVQSIDLARQVSPIPVELDSYTAQAIVVVPAIQWPLAAGTRIGDQFGPRNCAGCSKNHGGQDFNPGNGAPILSIADGIVSYTEDGEGSLGVHMIIDHMIDGQLISSVYAHMIHGTLQLKAGDPVLAGQVLGQVGSTGMSTGPHLHFEIRIGGIRGTKTDPLVWLRAHAF